MLKNKCCLYVIISIRFFSITICNLLIEFPSYILSSMTTTAYNTRTNNDTADYDKVLVVTICN